MAKIDAGGLFRAGAGGAAAASAYGLANYLGRDLLIKSSSPSAYLLKQIGLGVALGAAAVGASRADWVSPAFAQGAVGFLVVIGIVNVMVRAELPSGQVAGAAFPRMASSRLH